MSQAARPARMGTLRSATVTDSTEVEALRAAFAEHADTMAGRAPRWSQVSKAVATSEDAGPVLTALLQAAPPQRRPVLALAAVHDLALAHPHSPLAGLLARTEPTVTAAALWAAVIALVEEHEERFRHLVATRHTQTNEVGRCAVVMPPLAEIAAEVGPLGLVEFGASAGLLLNLDRYRYRYTLDGETVGVDPEAPPNPTATLTCGLRGAPVPSTTLPARPPTIASRLGVDPFPVNPADPEATRWLQACVWPDQRDRLATLQHALAALRHWPVPVVRDDGVDRVPIELERVDAHPVMMSSWALTYAPGPRRQELWDRLERLGRQRDLSLVLFEDPALVPEFPLPQRPDDRGRTVIAVIRWRSGRRQDQRLGTAHPHGYWWHREP